MYVDRLARKNTKCDCEDSVYLEWFDMHGTANACILVMMILMVGVMMKLFKSDHDSTTD